MGAVYRSALDNLLRVNTVSYRRAGREHRYNQTGLLTNAPGTFFRAGGGYSQPWTRDASINSWNAGSLLAPLVARNTLWSVVRRQANGALIVQQDIQWWDQAIWVVAAWNHFVVTGDRRFLELAYKAAADTLDADRRLHFNAEYGLFEGPSFLNDGIAGYPAPPADANESQGSFVLNYEGANKVMALSTNCIYVGAYRAAAEMANALRRPPDLSARWTGLADELAGRVRDRFWMADEGRFGYLLTRAGDFDRSQEGSGLAFSMLFGVATAEQAASMFQRAHLEPFGIVDVWPAFARYSPERPGRHNVILWPPIEGLWAEAAAHERNLPVFATALETLTGLAASDRNKFWEIYNSSTGIADGGWQVGRAWYSEPNQTWSATAYLSMIYTGLFGMRFEVDALRFAPLLPEGWGDVSLTGVHYRRAVLSIRLHGAGTVIHGFLVDGVPETKPVVPADLKGSHEIEIDMGVS